MNSQEKVKKIKELIKELELDFGPPATQKEISEMEKTLSLEFPQEYKEFLRIFGSLDDILGKETAGDSAVKATLSQKNWEHIKFPENLVVVHEDGYGNSYCVVCKGEDYGKVVFWQHDAPSNEVYPNYPEGKPDFWIEGPDFWTWLLEKLQRIKKIENEEKQKEEGLLF